MYSSSNPPRSRIESAVLRIRGLLETQRFAEALESSQSLLGEVPENRDVLYMLAVAQRFSQQIPAALATLAQLESVHPAYSRLFQERGYCHLAAREPAAARDAFLHAVRLNPALPACWKALEFLFRATGQATQAANAAGHVAILHKQPVPIVTARSLFADGEVHAAERVVRQFLQTHPDHIEGMRLLAQIGVKLEVLDDAEFLLESVLVFQPDYHLARRDYVDVLLKRQRHAKALAECDQLLRVTPNDRDYRALRATALVGLGEQEAALRVYRDLAAETPAAPDLQLSIAHACKTLGRQAEAITTYRSAAALRADYGDAYWSLANLKTYRFTDDEIARMHAYEAAAETAVIDRFHLCFALGKAHEDRQEYRDSFRYYERGNALKKAESQFRIEPIERNTALQKRVCTREFFAARCNVGCRRPGPIFIVGLPRAGSTLLEQILASHSAVEGTKELADIPRLVQSLQGRDGDAAEPRYPAALAELIADRIERLGEQYLDETRIYRTGKPFFIDKMPNNFRHLGLIHLILPNAKIIDARREPMACCFSNFKQLFATGQEFTYGLPDIARYYRTYVDLMNHWDAVLPGKVLRVQHEDLVDDLEREVRRILEFCGLPFEANCLEFHKTERSVRTASSEQVRRPINREGVDQWRHFEPWLEPLRQALGPLAKESRTDVDRAAPHDDTVVAPDRDAFEKY